MMTETKADFLDHRDVGVHFSEKYAANLGQRDFIPELTSSKPESGEQGGQSGESQSKKRKGLDDKPIHESGRIFEFPLRHPQNVHFASVPTYIPPKKVSYNFGNVVQTPAIPEGHFRL